MKNRRVTKAPCCFNTSSHRATFPTQNSFDELVDLVVHVHVHVCCGKELKHIIVYWKKSYIHVPTSTPKMPVVEFALEEYLHKHL